MTTTHLERWERLQAWSRRILECGLLSVTVRTYTLCHTWSSTIFTRIPVNVLRVVKARENFLHLERLERVLLWEHELFEVRAALVGRRRSCMQRSIARSTLWRCEAYVLQELQITSIMYNCTVILVHVRVLKYSLNIKIIQYEDRKLLYGYTWSRGSRRCS